MENIRIYNYNETEELKLKNVNIGFRNSSVNIGREYSNSIDITLNGCCDYDIIKKIINLKEKVDNYYKIDMHFGNEIMSYNKLEILSFSFEYDSKNNSFNYRIGLSANFRTTK
jgi:hypothetical protein